MCGRYSLSRDPEDLAREFEVARVDVREKLADFNVAPTRQVAAVLDRPPSDDEEAEPQRRLTLVRWGLIPSWAKDAKIGNRLINARLETAAEKPAFRRAFARRRCLIPADGYYEWYGEQKGKKQPFFIHPSDGGILAMAGLYEIWRDPSKEEDDPDRLVWTCTVLTTTAEDNVGRIHDRMPLLVEPAQYSTWLDPRLDDATKLRSVLVPAAPGRLDAYPVSTAVNNVRNNGPELREPLPAEEVDEQAGGLF
ncbi:SOS response-associated peptidase family protein [Actinopolymorpha pittospori]|uniref:Abasic site processing protein n=1 Tax=Actinopolymorpha pittospori TaxID=648752 RepID=A0A927N4N9_9ACTN|nr:putative SOS response-associated peptidase YedK [Actinopolymorpha pittospori]